MDSTLLKLVNPEFDFQFLDKTYKIRKAGLDKVVQYMDRAQTMNSQSTKTAGDTMRVVAFCISIVLYPLDNTITEQYVMENCPGDIDPVDIMTKLGFISPVRVSTVKTETINL